MNASVQRFVESEEPLLIRSSSIRGDFKWARTTTRFRTGTCASSAAISAGRITNTIVGTVQKDPGDPHAEVGAKVVIRLE